MVNIFKFLLILFFTVNTAFANMRAPWVINRYPSYSITKTNGELSVLSEDLIFNCDRVYEGDGDLSKILEKKCNVEAVYKIESNVAVKLNFEFVLPSEKNIWASINHSNEEMVQAKKIKLSDLEKEGYRLSDLCRFCEAEVNSLYTATFSGNLNIGENEIRVKYEQPLSATEVSYGYFKKSKWSNGFSYELWPLKEWKFDSNFKIKIKFTTEVGGVFSRFFSDKIAADCRGLDLRFKKSPTPFKKETDANGFNEYYNYNQNSNPYYLFKNSKTYYEKDKLIYELTLTDKFPDRLQCFFGNEKYSTEK